MFFYCCLRRWSERNCEQVDSSFLFRQNEMENEYEIEWWVLQGIVNDKMKTKCQQQRTNSIVYQNKSICRYIWGQCLEPVLCTFQIDLPEIETHEKKHPQYVWCQSQYILLKSWNEK